MVTCKEIINNWKLVRQSNHESYIYQPGQNLFKAKISLILTQSFLRKHPNKVFKVILGVYCPSTPFTVDFELAYVGCRRNRWRCCTEKGILKDFAISAGIHLCLSYFFLLKLQAFRPATLSKRDSNAGVSCEYCEIFKNIFWGASANDCFCW